MEREFAMKNVRIYFKKLGRMKFVSHLDMTRIMARLIKKSGIPVWYTEGFNRHIYMNFASPLSLGFESEYEIVDIRVNPEDYKYEDVLSSLQAVCPMDIEFFEATEPQLHTKEIGFSKYVLGFDEITEELKNALQDFFARESILCEKVGKKGRVKEIDIIPKIRSFEISGNDIILELVSGSEDNLNPNLVMDTFFKENGIEPLFYTVMRTLILDKKGNKFV